MKDPDSSRQSSKRSIEFERFEAFAKELISVPKAEIDKRAKEYERQKQRRKQSKKKKKE
jgi:hypothetical protein